MYSVSARIPSGVAFSLDATMAHFRGRGVRCERTESAHGGEGFRVFFGGWAIVAWYSEGDDILRDSRELAESDFKPFPSPADVIASCDRELALWSDENWDADHTDEWIEFVDELIRACPGM